jgi:hypothetical protein
VIETHNGCVFSLRRNAEKVDYDAFNVSGEVREAVRNFVSNFDEYPHRLIQKTFDTVNYSLTMSFDNGELSPGTKLHIESIKYFPLQKKEEAFNPEALKEFNRWHEPGNFIQVSQGFMKKRNKIWEMPRSSSVTASKISAFVENFLSECRDPKNKDFVEKVSEKGSHRVVHCTKGTIGLSLPHDRDRVPLYLEGLGNGFDIMHAVCYDPSASEEEDES